MKTMGSPISGESPVEARGKRTDLDNSLSSSSNQLPLLDANSNNNNTTNFVSAAAITGPVLVPPVPLSEGVVVAAKNPKRNAGRPGGAASNNPPAAVGTPGRLRVYKSNSTNKWVTREIAALEFLLGIPMEAERNIVHQGFMQQQGLVETKHEDKNLDVLEPPNNEHSQHNNNNGSGIPSSSNHGIPSISSHGRWWEKWINNPNPNKPSADPISRRSIFEELEQPSQLDDHIPESSTPKGQIPQGPHQQVVPVIHAPGRRLEGDEAIRVQIPLTVDISVITRQRSVARMAVTREWELQVAHGIGNTPTASNIQSDIKNPIRKVHPPMLDGRLFFSSAGSYPLQVYSLLRYEPKKEEAARRRQKLEARGGGGTQFFIMPARDWRGISYRALLPPRNQHRRLKKDDAIILFDRFATTSSAESSRDARSGGTKDNDKKKEDKYFDPLDDDDEEDEDEDDEEESDTYATGLLDDPEMVQGRHRTVMIGDRVTGCIVSSTIQFVKPELLKADLNKQFRERFDGWEPPKSQRKYIGARVNDGLYTLMEPGTGGDGGGTVGTAEEDLHQSNSTSTTTGITTLTPRKGQGSTSSLSTGAEAKETIRMPPSLTLSKIRSVKQQALVAAVKAKLEISTVALAIVYFERLCLDCRVDKTNRRLSFAACLLLSIKINEAHVGLVMTKTVEETSSKSTASNRIQSLIRPTKKSSTMVRGYFFAFVAMLYLHV